MGGKGRGWGQDGSNRPLAPIFIILGLVGGGFFVDNHLHS